MEPMLHLASWRGVKAVRRLLPPGSSARHSRAVTMPLAYCCCHPGRPCTITLPNSSHRYLHIYPPFIRLSYLFFYLSCTTKACVFLRIARALPCQSMDNI